MLSVTFPLLGLGTSYPRLSRDLCLSLAPVLSCTLLFNRQLSLFNLQFVQNWIKLLKVVQNPRLRGSFRAIERARRSVLTVPPVGSLGNDPGIGSKDEKVFIGAEGDPPRC